jgi:hypothetical protein
VCNRILHESQAFICKQDSGSKLGHDTEDELTSPLLPVGLEPQLSKDELGRYLVLGTGYWLEKNQGSLFTTPTEMNCKDPGPEGPALISHQRGGVYLRLPME